MTLPSAVDLRDVIFAYPGSLLSSPFGNGVSSAAVGYFLRALWQRQVNTTAFDSGFVAAAIR